MDQKKPWWTDESIAYVDEHLGRNQRMNAAFEWGSGASTHWLAARCGTVRTVEHDPSWATKAKELAAENSVVGVLEKKLDPNYEKAIERGPGEQYDLVAVDGRRRVQCVHRAAQYVKHHGLLVLDDSQRERYAPALSFLREWDRHDFQDHERTTTVLRRPGRDAAQVAAMPNPRPFFIPVRDRCGTLFSMLQWLWTHGHPQDQVHLVDMGSTYPKIVDWLKDIEAAGANVHRPGNIGARGLFKRGGIIEQVVGRKDSFFLSDPDIVPAPSCRLNLLQHMAACLGRYGDLTKVGLSLEITDIPDHFPHKQHILDFEARYWKKQLNGHLWDAAIATTFCIVRSLDHCDEKAYTKKGKDGRTVRPDIGIHTPWYLDPNKLPEDEAWYYKNTPRRRAGVPEPGTSWTLEPGSWTA